MFFSPLWLRRPLLRLGAAPPGIWGRRLLFLLRFFWGFRCSFPRISGFRSVEVVPSISLEFIASGSDPSR